MKKALSCEELERCFAEDAWLNYFNRYLFLNKLISKREYKQMIEMIAIRKARLSNKNKR